MYTIKYEPFLDLVDDKSYKNIVTINRMPEGPLHSCVAKVRRNKLSTFAEPHRRSCESQCVYVITQNVFNIEDERGDDPASCGCVGKGFRTFPGGSDYLCVEQIPDFLEIAIANNYTIDYKLSKLLSTTGVGSSNIRGSNFVCTLSYSK